MLKENNKGFTLIETVLSILLFSIIAASLFTALNQMVFSFKKQEKMAETQDNMRIVINWVTRDVKAAKEIESVGNGMGKSNALVLLMEDGTKKYYYYDIDRKVFYWEHSVNKQPLTNAGYILNNPPYTDFSPTYSFFEQDLQNSDIIKITIYGGYKEKNGEYVTSVMTTKVYRREFKLGEGG